MIGRVNCLLFDAPSIKISHCLTFTSQSLLIQMSYNYLHKYSFPDIDLEEYNTLTEDAVLDILKRHTFTDDEFKDICQRVMSESSEVTPSDATV